MVDRPGGFALTVSWSSENARHRDKHYAIDGGLLGLPTDLADEVGGLRVGESAARGYESGTVVDVLDLDAVRTLSREAVAQALPGRRLEPRVGRFYPRSLIASAIGGIPQDRRPFRVIGVDEEYVRVDLNHPLAAPPLHLEVEALAPGGGGRRNPHHMLAGILDTGPGMQAPYPGLATDFFFEYPFPRQDLADDEIFYRLPRLVEHIDDAAIARVTETYRRLLRPGFRVLDLMSSWTSHLASEPSDLSIIGLGMNQVELAKNRRLERFVVHDLNRSATLPFHDGEFDIVLCNVSVEYLIDPLAVFRDVARVLRSGGLFVNTFSDRWFTPKAISIWSELHPFERVGLVLELYRRSGEFHELETETTRGLPRPATDHYASIRAEADPVYAVWGARG